MSRPPRNPSKTPAATDASLAAAGLSRGRRSTRAASPTPIQRAPKPSPSAPTRRSAPGIVSILKWQAYPWLLAGFSTRQGGQTTAYAAGGPPEQNLGYTPEDDPATVIETRRRLVAALTKAQKASRIPTRIPDLITIRQCHTGIIRHVDISALPLATPDGKALLRGDALYTRDPNLLLGILTADCVPVLIADTRTRAVAAFHAGWRGTLARIVERGVGTLRREFGSRPQDLIAAIGPAVGPCCFAVGEEVRHEFDSQFAYAPQLFSEVYDSDPIREKYPMLFLTARAPGHSNLGPQIHLNLWEANRRQLLDAGLKASAITVIGECTACTRLRTGPRKYFSHRAEHGFTGRMLSIIGTTAS
jgi:YfiH family protein